MRDAESSTTRSFKLQVAAYTMDRAACLSAGQGLPPRRCVTDQPTGVPGVVFGVGAGGGLRRGGAGGARAEAGLKSAGERRRTQPLATKTESARRRKTADAHLTGWIGNY